MKVSVVIPCGPRHTDLLPRVVKNLVEGTVAPDEIIIAVSQVTDARGMSLQDALSTSGHITKVLYTRLKCGPGVNRNRGAAIATGDVICFIDADDVVHPQKIEIVKYIFTKYNPSIFLHSYFIDLGTKFPIYDNLQQLEESIPIITGDVIYKHTFGPSFLGNRYYRPSSSIWCDDTGTNSIHHGHSSILASVIKGPDALYFGDYAPGEDGNFCRDVLFKTHSMIYWNLPLLNYQRSGSWAL